MYKFTISFLDDSALAKTVLSNIASLSDDLGSGLHHIMVCKDKNRWIIEIFTSYILRNEEEVKTIFTDKKVNILSKLCGVDIYYKEIVKTKFSLGGVVPVPTYAITKPVEIMGQLLEAELQIEFRHDDMPYVGKDAFETIKPDDTWLSFMLRQSEQTQQSAFLGMLSDMTAIDSIEFSKLETSERDNFILTSMVHPEYRDFFKYMLNNHKLVNKEDIYSAIIHNANRVQSLQKVIIDTLIKETV